MNTEVAVNILVKLLIAFGSGAAAKYGIADASQQQIAYALAGAAVAGVSGIYGVWSHWGMKKVPQTAVISQAAKQPTSPITQAMRPNDQKKSQ